MADQAYPTLAQIDTLVQSGPFSDSWASLVNYRTPDWYRKLKFGIFIHWGVYSVPAFGNEWYPRNMYMQDSPEFRHHVATYGPHKAFGYKDFIPLFRAERFDPEAWATLFARSGAKYVVPVAEHHDGFQMYRSAISHWNAFEMGPRRDVLGELSAACRSKGLVMGASSHRIEHWFFLGHGREFDSDIHEPLVRGDFYWPSMPEPKWHDIYGQPAPSQEYMEDWLMRTCELIDRYHPSIIYFDWWIEHSAAKPWIRKLAAYYYNQAAARGEEVVINYKHDAFLFGAAVPDVERGQFNEIKPFIWQTDTSVARNSWGYTEGNDYKSAEELIWNLVDVVSKNGNFLLNIGPKADGTIPEEDARLLQEIGAWLDVNGEAIYGSRPWRMFGEGPTQLVEGQFSDDVAPNFTDRDFRFTMKGDALYVIAMKCSDRGEYCVRALGELDASRQANFHGIIRHVRLLGADAELPWTRDEAGLHLHSPARSATPLVFKITLE
jgi:alpha-L-fucosidase